MERLNDSMQKEPGEYDSHMSEQYPKVSSTCHVGNVFVLPSALIGARREVFRRPTMKFLSISTPTDSGSR